LLDNAIKYTPAGGEVTVSASTTPQWVNVNVHDSGPGIDPEMLPHIFERFYRGDVARRGTGVGLGLAIAKALVEAQRGQISVQTEAGEGSTFTISLPRATPRARSQREHSRQLTAVD
jgi:two-component system, OmpR family, sensor kinase